MDIDIKTGLIDIEDLQRRLDIASKQEKIPKILVVVHLAGTSCDMKKIRETTKKYNIILVEDASHAIGGKYDSINVGSCMYSDMCIFSFHPVKIITTGEGGMIVTNNSLWANTIRKLRSHGITKDSSEFRLGKQNLWTYEQHMLGFNYRMTDIQAALGVSQISRLQEIVSIRNVLFDNYIDMLKGRDFQFKCWKFQT